MRIMADLNEKQLKGLASFCEQEKISRAEAIRRAVDTLVMQKNKERGLKQLYGMWKDRGIDGLEYERRLREEWPE